MDYEYTYEGLPCWILERRGDLVVIKVISPETGRPAALTTTAASLKAVDAAAPPPAG